MMLHAKEIEQAVNGQLVFEGDAKSLVISSVEFDTRKIQTNSLFVPLKGARDGHELIENAVEQGASLVLSESSLDEAIPHILVDNTLVALQELAKMYLKKVNPKVVGVTGSNGKTTTKDMIASVLSTTYLTYKTQGNYNNDIGLPYTILHMPENTEMLVLEMGMDHKDEITVLSHIAEPDVSVITMVGESHLENLGSREGIAAAKMEIVDGMKKDGLLIVPKDEPLLSPLLKNVTQSIQTFGIGEEGTIRGALKSESKEKTCFTTNLYGEEIFSIPVIGSYNVNNGLAALLVGRYFDIPEKSLVEGLSQFSLTQQRTEWLQTKKGTTILSDVYNANPTAMKLVISSFSRVATQGKRVVVLGDMLELGQTSVALHQSVSDVMSSKEIDEVYLYGEKMHDLYLVLQNKFSENNLHYFDANQKKELMLAVANNLKAKDMVLLKASNGMGLQEIVDYLLNS